MKQLKTGEVWFAEFPLEEDPRNFINRPVIILDVDSLDVLSVKVTKHEVRQEDSYDTPIMHWEDAKLKFASTARISKTIKLPIDNFIFKIGDLKQEDLEEITDMYIKFVNKELFTKQR